ncbi:MAG: TrkH family potassium uptake protein [Candidatus Cloacimonetes bacterium]|nr:TrkH family potassium uptake protein [Candidatus Cloacimonadota bacterium]
MTDERSETALFSTELCKRLKQVLHGLALINLLLLLGSYHYSTSSGYQNIEQWTIRATFYFFIAYLIHKLIANKFAWVYIRTMLIDVVIITIQITAGADDRLFQLYIVGRQIFAISRDSSHNVYHKQIMSRLQQNPAVFVLSSFFIAILIGTFLLSLPWAVNQDAGEVECLSITDAVFTATSATCVTGLIVKDTGNYFSRFGHIVILLLIQVGGLGIMTISTALTILLGQQITLKSTSLMQDVTGSSGSFSLRSLLKNIFLVTIFFEAVGAIILYYSFPQSSTSSPVFNAVFHSVSAFCNAGFSLYSESMMPFAPLPSINFIVMGLIIVGGIGFPVMMDLKNNLLRRFKPSRFRLHTKIVLTTTGLLIIIGAVGFYVAEYSNTMRDMTFFQKMQASLFQSVTARTAGFNTINNGALTSSSVLLCMILMFIGASPGSTGGGVKTTTFAILVLAVWSIIKGSGKEITVFKRRISDETSRKVLALLAMSLGFLLLMTFILLALETASGKDFQQIVFEAMSAFATVGLSMGITSGLTSAGKVIITILMFIGRVGPLTFVYALSESRILSRVSYMEENVSIG